MSGRNSAAESTARDLTRLPVKTRLVCDFIPPGWWRRAARLRAAPVPYVLGEKEHLEFLNTTADIDRRRAAAGIARFAPGHTYPPHEAVPLFEQAGLFDREIERLIPGLIAPEVEQFATWMMVVNSARRECR